MHSLLSSLGYYGSNRTSDNIVLPDQKEVQANQIALVLLIIGILLIVSIFYL